MAEFSLTIDPKRLEAFIRKVLLVPEVFSVHLGTQIETLFLEALGECEFWKNADDDDVGDITFSTAATDFSASWLVQRLDGIYLFLETEEAPKEAARALKPLFDLMEEHEITKKQSG